MQEIISSIVTVPTAANGITLKKRTGNVSYVRIENQDGTDPIWVHHGDDAPTILNGAKLVAGAVLEISLSSNNRIGNRISAISTGGNVLTLVDTG